MKISKKDLFLLPALIAGLGLMPASQVSAQTFTTLHHFGGSPSDGSNPFAGLVLSGDTLYGAAWTGGSSGSGAVFAVNANGTGYTNLHHFSYSSDGSSPYAGLILSGGTLYGTTYFGGGDGNGTIFSVNTNGSGFANLHDFAVRDGANPYAGLILSGGTLYGTTGKGDSAGSGTLFSVGTNGSGFTNPLAFTGGNGATPHAGLILFGSTLYGTTGKGGSSGNGVIFAINTDGTSFTNLHNFSAVAGAAFTNSDGANPYARLLLAGGTLYGTTYAGGIAGNGTVFAINTDGTGFTNLHSFAGGTPIDTNEDGIIYANSDGINPNGGLVMSGNALFGTAVNGGSAGEGAVFAVNTDGSGFTNLYNFTGGGDGAGPLAGLILSGNTLYGTARAGGSSSAGTVFSLSFAPQLTIIPSGANVILTWPTNVAGFDYTALTLRSTTNLILPSVWSTVSTGPFVVNGQNSVTNPVSGTQRFYRLSR